MSIPNKYTHRKVAATAPRACDVCMKPSSSVLITDNKEDFFYVCPSHLKDRNFCLPDKSHAEALAERERQQILEELKKEQKEKDEKKAKAEKEKAEKEKEKEKDESKNESKDDKPKDEAAAAEKPEDKAPEKTPADNTPADPAADNDDEPRVFNLKPTFFQARVSKKRQAEYTKLQAERMRTPGLFPSVPKGLPGS